MLKSTLAAVEAVLAKLTPPSEPQPGELVDALIHIMYADGLPCGYGQEILRRIDTDFVDRNEFRVTEAYEVEEAFSDLKMPDAFERCRLVKDTVIQVHNDQNRIGLEFLREAGVAERKGFFQRVPAISTKHMNFLGQVVGYEEILFSPRSTQRVQLRLGFEPKAAATDAFFGRLRELVAPFGHLPLQVGPKTADRKPILDPELCPLCLITRIGAK